MSLPIFIGVRALFILIISFCLAARGLAQTTFPVNGAPFQPGTIYAFEHATIYIDYQTRIDDATLIIKQNRVLACGKDVKVPADAVVIDLKGCYIYPAFIDLWSDYGLQNFRHPRKASPGPQMESGIKGAYGWNQAIRPELDASRIFIHNREKSEELRRSGFATVLTHAADGIVRGSGALVHLDDSRENESIILARSGAFFSFSKGSSTQDYPSSLTGAIALMRQTLYDLQWYEASKERTEYNTSLEELLRLRPLPAFFDAGDKYNTLRASVIANEFKMKFIVHGSGNEYQRGEDIKAAGVRMILPLDFPAPIDLDDPFTADMVSLGEMKHWELAPANPAILSRLGVEFCFTSSGLKDRNAFLSNLRKTIQHGLSEEIALKALTFSPASFAGQQGVLGALRPGYFADFIVCSDNIFQKGVIMQCWSNGKPASFVDAESPDIRGTWGLTTQNRTYTISFNGDRYHPTARIRIDSAVKKFSYSFSRNLLSFSLPLDTIRFLRAALRYEPGASVFEGNIRLDDGKWQNTVLRQISRDTTRTPVAENIVPAIHGEIYYPFSAFGEPLRVRKGSISEDIAALKGNGDLLIRNATVWTNEKDSVLLDCDVLVRNGKIAGIGKNLKAENIPVIDGTGKHLTPGIIDEHSHIALTAGVNEGAQASSAEVRMGDVINPEDINIYRQLAGGVTTSQLLHGSANPIGGQSVLIKLRWGQSAEMLRFGNAPPFIKFALGENVKQSNWGDLNVVRFPQSRMGVEQVFNDYFTRAREYGMALKSSSTKKKENGAVIRKDLELDAVLEILEGKRFITCHSYVQSELNMLMRLSDSLKFRINTFTHILEGYKVADKMKARGIFASTFSDWWAYKNEVLDAIPYNAVLMSKAGIVTAINSDDAEMARRLNQEAAKSVRYGGMSAVQALKMVTLNPALMLHIDDKVGSIRVGKSADLVIWSADPLSVYAVAEVTIIDGRIYFDRKKDLALREQNRNERARIAARMNSARKAGDQAEKPVIKRPRLYHCNTIEGVSEEITGHR